MDHGPFGVEIEQLDTAAAGALVSAWCGDGVLDDQITHTLGRCGDQVTWLLAHCDDGVGWGRFAAGDTRVSWAPADTMRGTSVRPNPQRVQQIRAFGTQGEILCWRDEDARGSFLARSARDAGMPGPPFHPMDQIYLLFGNRVEGTLDGGFSVLASPQGYRQTVPLTLTEAPFIAANQPDGPRRSRYGACLEVRHYFRREESGAVRRALTRAVGLRPLDEEEATVTPQQEDV